MGFYSIFAYITTLSVIIPTLLAFFKLKSLDTSLRLLSLYLIITTVKELVCVYYSYNQWYNIHIYNPLRIVEFFIMPLIYYKAFTNKKFKNITKYAIVLITSVYLVNLLFIQGLNKFNTYTIIVGRISLIIITLLYFFELLQKVETTSLYREPMLWISTGLLFYSVGSFLIHGLYDLHSNFPADLSKKIWAINSILNLFLNLIYSIAFLCKPQSQK